MATTTKFLLPYPGGSASPNVPADLLALVNRLEALLGGLVPVGASVGYGGSADPAGGFFLLEDGRTLDSIDDPSLAQLYSTIGTTFGGTGPSNFRLPDSRGRSEVMPRGTAPAGNDRITVALGQVFGEVAHLLTGTESGVNQNGKTVSKNTGITATGLVSGSQDGGIDGAVALMGSIAVPSQSSQNISINDPGHVHDLVGRSADTPHNTVHPVICKNKIIRVR